MTQMKNFKENKVNNNKEGDLLKLVEELKYVAEGGTIDKDKEVANKNRNTDTDTTNTKAETP